MQTAYGGRSIDIRRVAISFDSANPRSDRIFSLEPFPLTEKESFVGSWNPHRIHLRMPVAIPLPSQPRLAPRISTSRLSRRTCPMLEECEVEPHDLATQPGLQLSADPGFDVLLVADAPVDVVGSDHGFAATRWSGPEWLRDPGTLLLAWTLRCWVRPMSCLGSAVEAA
jgi:hypothetical protein